MTVYRGERGALLRVARHLNPPLLNTPPPTPYPTQTKAPPRTAVNNTLERLLWVRYIPSLVAAVGGNRPLDKLGNVWYNTRVEKNGNEQLQGSHTHINQEQNMLTVKIRRNENPERAVSRLKNLMMKEGVLNDLKRKRYFQKPSLKRRLKKENAARQRVKDLHKDIRAAQRAEENFLQ